MRRLISFVLMAAVTLFVLCPLCALFGWGHEGHQVIGWIAEHYMSPAAVKAATDLLGGVPIDSVASWADDYRHDHPETGPWHYIDIPLGSDFDIAKECPNGQCVVAQTEIFLAVLKNSQFDKAQKAEALRFVVHFIGDLHQPLHDADNGDKGGNGRHVIFDGKPDNLHWVWDTGLLEHINSNPEALATELEVKITPQDTTEWDQGGIGEWVLEGHQLAQKVAYGDLGADNPAVITPEYEKQADPVIETQLEKAGVRLAYVLNQALGEGVTGASAVQSLASGATPTQAEASRIPKRLTFGGEVEEGRKSYAPPPKYPKKARNARLQGLVRLAAVIGTDGTVRDLHLINGPPLLVDATMQAVSTWRYTPTVVYGEPVEVDTEIDVNFTLIK